MLYFTTQEGWVCRKREERHRRYSKFPHADVDGTDALWARYTERNGGASLTLLQLLLAYLPQFVDLGR